MESFFVVATVVQLDAIAEFGARSLVQKHSWLKVLHTVVVEMGPMSMKLLVDVTVVYS